MSAMERAAWLAFMNRTASSVAVKEALGTAVGDLGGEMEAEILVRVERQEHEPRQHCKGV